LIAKLKYHLFLGLALLTACAPEAPQKTADIPDWVIPEDKMINILTDVHIIEGARIGKKVLGDSLYALDHYMKLWDKHHIRESQYDSSFRFYSRNAEKMDVLYEQVLTNLSTMSSAVEGEIEAVTEPEIGASNSQVEVIDTSKVTPEREKDSSATQKTTAISADKS